MKFINREHELGHLESEYKEGKPKFVVIYGRRRVGKTRLIQEFAEGKKVAYYTAAQESEKQQVAEFRAIIANVLGDKFLMEAKLDDWKQLFGYLPKTWPKKERIILAIDEVTFIIKSNRSFPSYLQKLWDSFLSKTNTFLILSGSLMGMMLHDVLEYPSPLYGRRTSQIFLKPLDFKNAAKFLEAFSFEDKIRYYSIIGGIPKYLELISPKENFEHFINEKFLDKEGFFYQEAMFLISQEFHEPSTYMGILKSISFGNTKLNEISAFTGMEAKIISRYLDILITMGLIKKETPVTEDAKKSRNSIYLLNDPFLIFWYRFVQPNISYIEIRQSDKVWAEIKGSINSLVGKAFEEVCKESLLSTAGPGIRIGRWWSRKGDEIDIVAINEKEGEITFAECKWQENVDATKILKELKEKSAYVNWRSERRKENYAIFAKSFSHGVKEPGLALYSLEDMEKAMLK